METYTVIGDESNQTSAWQLTGYSNDNTDKGIVYAKIYEDSGNYYVSVYSEDSMETASLVAEGSIATAKGAVTLLEQNSSGLTGSVKIAYTQDAQLAIIVFYACYEDLCEVERNLNQYLTDGIIANRKRFESFIEHGKRLIDVHIEVLFLRSGFSNPPTRENIADASSLKVPAIYAALSSLYWFLKEDFNDSYFKLALEYERKLENRLANNPIVFSRGDVEIVLEGAVYIRHAKK